MLPREILEKVRRIELVARKRVDEQTAGAYRSQLRGQGVQFAEHRVYVPGDDVRHIDWKVSARSQETLLKKYEEERELTALFLVDASGSQAFGTQARFKSEVAAEAAGLLAFAADRAGDRTGLLLFGSGVAKKGGLLTIPPAKGRQHVLRIIREVLAAEPAAAAAKAAGPRVGLGDALQAAHRVMKHRGLVVLLSDFVPEGEAADERAELWVRRLARRHEVIALAVSDPREETPAGSGHALLLDPESGREAWVDLGSYSFGEFLRRAREQREARLRGMRAVGADVLRLSAAGGYLDALVAFLRRRAEPGAGAPRAIAGATDGAPAGAAAPSVLEKAAVGKAARAGAKPAR